MCTLPYMALIISVLVRDAIATEPCVLASFDCLKMSPRDLAVIRGNAAPRASKAGAVDSVCLWFECEFGEGGGVLRTGPRDSPTHWMQTVMPLGQGVEVIFPTLPTSTCTRPAEAIPVINQAQPEPSPHTQESTLDVFWFWFWF